MTGTLAQQAAQLADAAADLADRLAALEAEDDRVFSKEDVDRIVAGRLAREQKRTRRAEAERDELESELEDQRRGLESPTG